MSKTVYLRFLAKHTTAYIVAILDAPKADRLTPVHRILLRIALRRRGVIAR